MILELGALGECLLSSCSSVDVVTYHDFLDVVLPLPKVWRSKSPVERVKQTEVKPLDLYGWYVEDKPILERVALKTDLWELEPSFYLWTSCFITYHAFLPQGFTNQVVVHQIPKLCSSIHQGPWDPREPIQSSPTAHHGLSSRCSWRLTSTHLANSKNVCKTCELVGQYVARCCFSHLEYIGLYEI